uniref:ATP synthase F0 subunit 8 n=1 Tax=Phyllidiella hageni TaxID=2873953 RepID=A0AA96RNH1_9GAST|nr:ATP synthase F0 subunit 8 [Phyllidiella hageni]WNR50675.1 ATP synthase F0 subunit 8 [Phyllidiella hageni]WNR50688.1 ATP synthase F0 subunit 8 [Phyllidiella hageni]WNR50701.1 ATP synthase F0 subunit 8 [Phyllidiella hageni]
MPQLSPMMGFIMFLCVLASFFLLMCTLSLKHPFVKLTKMNKSSKTSLPYF